MKKLPDDAYAYYLLLGARRSHQAVADHFDVDKKTVTNRAVKENWKERIEQHDRQRREAAEKKATEDLNAMDDRQLKVAHYIQAKAIETMKTTPIDSAMDAVKAYKLAVEMERMIRGRPKQDSVAEIEEKIRAEHEQWLRPEDEDPASEPASEVTDPQVEGKTPADGGASPEAPAPEV